MPRRVNPALLLGIIIVIVLSVGLTAAAQMLADPMKALPADTQMLGPMGAVPAGGTAFDAVGVGEAQLGKPFMMATDGPSTFSCSGLMRYILRTIGVEFDAPWVPEAYLSVYAPVDPINMQPGDIVIYPGWATMYVGNGMVLNANQLVGVVTETPMDFAGVPLGIVRPPYL